MNFSDVDLHTHSTFSDGVLTPTELVDRAARRSVRTLALTDHDEVRGLEEARTAAEARGITLVQGVEISVTWQQRTIHVVGLRIDSAHAGLAAGLEGIRTGRRLRAQRIADALGAAGIPDTLAGARAHARNPDLVGRTHFARHLVERGIARDVASVFKRYLTSGNPGHVPHQWATLQEAVHSIVSAGGIPVLAHPGRYRLTESERDCLLEEFRAFGGRAIEVVTGSHSVDEFGYWAGRARRHGLMGSTGSDFHAPGESYRDVGDLPASPYGCVPLWKHW